MAGRKATPFGKKVKKKLVDLDMTQVELAQKLGTTKGYINRILSGERSGEKYRKEICRILGINDAA